MATQTATCIRIFSARRGGGKKQTTTTTNKTTTATKSKTTATTTTSDWLSARPCFYPPSVCPSDCALDRLTANIELLKIEGTLFWVVYVSFR